MSEPTAWFIVTCDTLQSYEPEKRFPTENDARKEIARINKLGHTAILCLVQVIAVAPPPEG